MYELYNVGIKGAWFGDKCARVYDLNSPKEGGLVSSAGAWDGAQPHDLDRLPRRVVNMGLIISRRHFLVSAAACQQLTLDLSAALHLA